MLALTDLAYDQIDKLESPNFFISIGSIEGVSSRQPSGKRIRAFLKKHLTSLNPDRVAEEYTELQRDFPSWVYEEEGLKIEFGVG